MAATLYGLNLDVVFASSMLCEGTWRKIGAVSSISSGWKPGNSRLYQALNAWEMGRWSSVFVEQFIADVFEPDSHSHLCVKKVHRNAKIHKTFKWAVFLTGDKGPVPAAGENYGRLGARCMAALILRFCPVPSKTICTPYQSQ